MKKNLVSIIIVHYQVEAVLFSCLKSIWTHQSKASFEVIVVDNGSHGGFKKRLVDQFPTTHYLKSPKNLGYGAGNNFGAAQATGEFLFFLNPDTEVLPGCVESLMGFLRMHQQVGIVAPTLLHSNMQLFDQQGSLTLTPLRAIAAHSIVHRLWPNNPVSKKFWLVGVSKEYDRKVAVVPGTALMISKRDFFAISGFDESFFLYFEEYDICQRILAANKEIWMLGSARIVHVWEASTSGEDTTAVYKDSMKKYLIKYYGSIIGQLTFIVTQLSKNQLTMFSVLLLIIIAAWLSR